MRRMAASKIWDEFQADRAWLNIHTIIPFDRILAIDEIGDEYFDEVHLYCRYEGGIPFDGSYFAIEPVDTFQQNRIWVDGSKDERRIEKFPSEFRLKE